MPLALFPLYQVGQEIYLQRNQATFQKGSKVKVRRRTAMIGGFRYEVERDHQREWCMEPDLGRHPPP